MKIRTLFIALLIITGCKDKKEAAKLLSNEVNEEVSSSNFKLEVYDFNGFESFLNKQNNTTYVVNFWATWCAPCVKELPYFEKLNKTYSNKNVEVILVSLDFPHLYEKKLMPFVKKHQLTSKVIALNDVDMNTWIPQVDTNWSGSIPATIIYKNDSKKFFEQSFTYEELETELKQFLN